MELVNDLALALEYRVCVKAVDPLLSLGVGPNPQ